MQQHMMQKHGIRVSLRDKDEHGRVIERPLPRTLRKGVKVDALVRTKPVGYTSPAMSSTSESDFSDDENEPDNPPRPQETQPVTPATAPLADIDIDVPSDADSWQPYVHGTRGMEGLWSLLLCSYVVDGYMLLLPLCVCCMFAHGFRLCRLELRLDEAEELAETAMNLWGELSFARMAGDLLYSEDEVYVPARRK
jgi:hypothetical protein